MATIAEKYEKFLLTDELVESFSKFSGNNYQYSADSEKIEVKTFRKDTTINEALDEELDNA